MSQENIVIDSHPEGEIEKYSSSFEALERIRERVMELSRDQNEFVELIISGPQPEENPEVYKNRRATFKIMLRDSLISIQSDIIQVSELFPIDRIDQGVVLSDFQESVIVMTELFVKLAASVATVIVLSSEP